MVKREDGKETRARLLASACEVFSKKSYRDAKIADICRVAGANVAAVNYYFGDKASLYKEAWLYAIENLEQLPFPKTASSSPHDSLRQYVHMLIEYFASDDRIGQFSRFYLLELLNPTGLIQDAWHEMIEPRRVELHNLIRDIIGPEANKQTIIFCELSIINQCRALVTTKSSDLQYLLGQSLSPELIKQLARHIAEFSLAGIKAVGHKRQA